MLNFETRIIIKFYYLLIDSTQSVIYYEEEPSALIQNFQPFDLESWWSKRLYNKITKSL